jgi:hypothetical protein
MAEDLITYPEQEEKLTRRTVALTQEQALEILAQAVLNCQQVGIDARISPLFYGGKREMLVVLANVVLVDGKLVMVKDGEHGTV